MRHKIIRSGLTFLILILVLCYPFAIYFGVQYISPRYLALLIAIIFILRFMLLKASSAKKVGKIPFLIVGIGLVICILGVCLNSLWMMKLYPILISMLMLGVFGFSLLYPPTVIERLARITEPELPEEAIAYTRKVTIVWCLFFLFNISISLWTMLFASTKVWAFYNGFLFYILMGTLFGVEFIIRFFVKRKIKLSQR